jgi:hypothetical protein
MNSETSRLVARRDAVGASHDAERIHVMSHVLPPSAVCRVSFGQVYILASTILGRDVGQYNNRVVHRLSGDVDVEAWRRAEQMLVDRHAILRTTLAPAGEKFEQTIHASRPAAFEVIDGDGWPDERILAAVDDAANTPFDLARGPLFRGYLFRQSSAKHYLMHVWHEAILDRLSWDLAQQELLSYASGCRPRAAPASTYADYVEWQHAYIDSPAGVRHWEYWNRELQGTPPSTLPVDHARSGRRTGKVAAIHVEFPAPLIGSVRALAQRRRTTMNRVFLTVFQVLLHQQAGADDFLVACPMVGRRKPFTEVLGRFTNPVLIRATLSPDLTFAALLDQTSRRVTHALDHQMFPIGLVLQRLRVPGWVGGGALNVLFDFVTGLPPLTARVGDATIERFEFEEPKAQRDLEMHFFGRGDVFVAWLRYDAELFEASTVEGLARHYQVLLRAALDSPDLPLIAFPRS